MWSGTLSFGLINIPVQLYSGMIEHPFDLDMLHKKDLSPIRYAKICKAEEVEIPYKDVVKGYEVEKGEYILLTEEELASIGSKKTKTIDIQYFTYEQEVNSIFFDKIYYLVPDKGAARAYSLLVEALNRSEKVAIATYVFRSRPHVGMVKAHNRILILNQLRYESDIRDEKQLEISHEKSQPKELQMAVQVIDQLTDSFDPKAFKDTYREDLKKIIEKKSKGIKPSKGVVKSVKATTAGDILSKLQASLQKYHIKKKVHTPLKRKVKKIAQ